MGLNIAGHVIMNRAALSEPCCLVLNLIDGGQAWFEWAVTTINERYSFTDETELLVQLQQKLHGSRFILLPRLQLLISPATLLTLDQDDLHLLTTIEAGDESATTIIKARALLVRHGFITRNDLSVVHDFLEELGVSGMPLFQALDLRDSLALHKLLAEQDSVTMALMQEAAAFSVTQATTPSEFCDYYCFYLDLATTDDTTTPELRSQKAMAVLNALTPLVFGALDCPQLSGSTSPMEILAIIRDLNAQQKLPGFNSVARAIQQIARHSGLLATPTSNPVQVVQQYLQAALAFLGKNNRFTVRLEQDATTVARLEADTEYAELCLASSGMFWLSEFGVRVK